MSTITISRDYFTCITCRVAFKDAEFQRLHYKTDWHRYNLKRKVAELSPVTAEEFQRRVLNQRNADEIMKQEKTVYCSACHKSFGNQNAYDNHLNSKKHKDNEKSQKLVTGFMCLWCNEKGRTFHSADSARQHMLDKGHCKMIHEGVALAEYADFYDYSSSYPDANKEDVNIDEEVSVPELDGSDYQLVLPSGVTIGHRSLMRYYKQSINPNRAVAIPSQNTKKLHKVLAHYRALGWTETQQAAAAKKARDIHYMKRLQAKYNVKMGTKNNNILQKHFRRQVQF